MASVARCMRAVRIPSLSLGRIPVAPRQVPRIARTPSQRLFSSTRLLQERKYTRDHEWIDLSADRTSGVMGISEYAAEALGDVVYVELPEVTGAWIEQGDPVGAVESVKSAADINAPLRLRVTHVNSLLEEKPATVSQVPEDDSHGGGWIAKVEVDEQSLQGLEKLMDSEAYKAFTASDH